MMSNVEEACAELGITPRPRIEIGEDAEVMADAAIAALAADERDDHDRIYQRGGRLVRVVPSEEPGEATTQVIRVVATATLYERLSAVADWGRWVTRKGKDEPEWKPCTPPKDVVSAVASRGSWDGIRHLVGITSIPVMRADGSILQTTGYDAATGLIYEPNAVYARVPEAPSWLDAATAAMALDEVVIDFPFATPGDHAAWLAVLLTMLARPAIRGNTPFFVFDAPTRGSGKGKLVDAVGVIATGRKIPTRILSAEDAEMRKKITTIILEGRSVVHWDNVTIPIGGESLESLATSATWGDRILGKTEDIELPKKVVCLFSGNNVQYTGDAARRILPIRIVPREEHPEDRVDFLHKDLLGWIAANRARLVVAALTMLRAWVAAGRPMPAGGAYGSFEEWFALVVQVVRWLGFPDPMTVRVGLEEKSDPTKAALVHIVESWQAAFGQRATTAKQIHDRLELGELSELRDSFLALASNDNLSARSLAEVLSRHKDRVVSGRVIKTTGLVRGVQTWSCSKTG